MLTRLVACGLSLMLAFAFASQVFAVTENLSAGAMPHASEVEQTVCRCVGSNHGSGQAAPAHASAPCSVDMAPLGAAVTYAAEKGQRAALGFRASRREGLPQGPPRKPPRALS